jgi:hypothetical protein
VPKVGSSGADPLWPHSYKVANSVNIFIEFKGSFGCNLEALDLV